MDQIITTLLEPTLSLASADGGEGDDDRIGDVLCFENAGAYCMTEGIALFLSRDVPAVYLIREDGTAVCVRKPFETLQLNTPNYDL